LLPHITLTDNLYYRKYNDLLKKHERISYRIALNGLKSIFKSASKLYADNPSIPVELLLNDEDTLKIIIDIYDSVGIEMAKFVDSTFPKVKQSGLQLQTKAKAQQPYKIDNSPKINYWKEEFIRFSQSPECAKKVTNVTNTTRDQIRKIMNEAGEQGLSHKQVAKKIIAEADEITTKKRALLIARTENAIASNKAAYFASQSSGLILYKKWIARSGDDRTRDFHASMIGRDPIPMDSLFDVGDEKMLHPGDSANGATAKNICNCRCIVGFIPASEVISPAIVSPQQEPIINRPAQLDVFETVKPLQRVFKPARSLLEAEAFITESGIAKNVDYVWIKDLEVANEINQTLFELQETYGLRQLETVGQNVKSKTAYMSANFQRLSINHNIFKNLDTINATYEKYEAGFLDIITNNIEIVKKNIVKSNGALKWRKMLVDLEEQQKFGRYTVHYGKETLTSDTIIHEFAHILHDQKTGGINGLMGVNKGMINANGQLNDLAKDLNRENYNNYIKARSNGNKYKISVYGMTNEHEFFAETFVMYHRKDPALPNYMVEYFDRFFALTK
jgi:hypothetical protein